MDLTSVRNSFLMRLMKNKDVNWSVVVMWPPFSLEHRSFQHWLVINVINNFYTWKKNLLQLYSMLFCECLAQGLRLYWRHACVYETSLAPQYIDRIWWVFLAALPAPPPPFFKKSIQQNFACCPRKHDRNPLVIVVL